MMIADLYKTDLERHLFAPSFRAGRTSRWLDQAEAAMDWLRARLSATWLAILTAIAFRS